MGPRLEDWKRFLDSSPAVIRLKGAHLVLWRRWPGTGAALGPENSRPSAVSPEDLRQRLVDNRELITVSARHLAWATALLPRVRHVLHLLDRDGVVLCSTGSEPLAEALGLLPGRDWSEQSVGANGAGTALACGLPAAAVGPGEWGGPGDDWTCAGAPIHDPGGALLGAVGVGTPVADGGPERLALAAYLAWGIGQELGLRQGPGPSVAARPSPGDLSALVAEVAALHPEVAARAHERWVGKERPTNTREQDWAEAEAELHQARGISCRVADAQARIADRERVVRVRLAERGVTRALASAAAPGDAVPACLRAVCEAVGWEMGVFWRPDTRTGVLRFAGSWQAPVAALGAFEDAARRATFAPGVGMPGRSWVGEQATWAPELAEVADSPLAPASGAAGLRRSCCLPVSDGGAFLGAMQFFSRRPHGPDDEELPVMMADIGSQVAQFLRRFEAEGALRVQQEEARLARQIQQGFLPRQAPVVGGFSLAGRSRAAAGVGGDYFDFFSLAGGLGVVVGDVSGHGVGAALLMGQARACLRALALVDEDPGTLLALTNGRLAEDMEPDCFVTLFLGRLDSRNRSLAYSSAGHWPGYVLDRRGAVRAALPSTGLPLGVAPGAEFPTAPAVALASGDLVLLLTDGVVEAFAPDGGVFGSDRALEVALRHRHEPAAAIAEAVLRAVGDFCGPVQVDDQTAVVIKAE